MKRHEIESLLPSVVQRSIRPFSPLSAILDVMEALLRPSVEAMSRLDAAFDPRRTADDFVPFLARWVDMDRLFPEVRKEEERIVWSQSTISTGLGRLRELVASAAYISRWRGTTKGLHRFLLTATGQQDFEIKENVDRDGRSKLFHLLIVTPASMHLHKVLIERIIESEKPAYVTYDLVIKSEP